MKLIFLACLVVVALARPQDPKTSQTLRSENINEGDGHFKYGFETDTGIKVDALGTPGSEGQSNINGNFKFPLGNGQHLEVVYEADENGYRPSVKFVRS
ncbi:hypothetical protein OTU49_000263 [Cherax quadricarinatus]|uniref:Uncharacterized protein n=1 Tax=Cherax quadricarinatus TaxID=27406 RepID=A0AAW0Y102_CHEQU